MNEKGYQSKCSICESINHWAHACPDADALFCQSSQADCQEESDEFQVALFQSNLLNEESHKVFVSESLSCAILDSGATSTVSGKVWTDCYVEGLPAEKQKLVTYSDSGNSFRFGSGDVYKSLYKVKLPAMIGKKSVCITTDVVKSDIPMLLSRKSMKKANTKINFKDDTVNMFDVKQNVILTNSGHYAVPLTESKNILETVQSSNAKVVLHADAMEGDKKKMAQKLHSQFCHPPVKRLLQLIKAAGLGNDAELIKHIYEISESCSICLEYKRPSPRPVVGLPLATKFNEVVAMDLKMIDGKWVLHLIDHVSRFSAAGFVASKRPEDIIKVICRIWIQVFGPPKSFLSDNGGEFNNDNFRSMCERFNIFVKTTAAESPWSNGLCERHNAVLNDMYLKTAAETGSSREMVLNWAIHAKNSLANVHGFSPYQLAIGYTPHIAGVLNDGAPALENDAASEFLRESLNNMAAARKAFVQSENSEKIRRALRHNIRPSANNKFFNGNNVIYKLNDSKKWKGPGIVIGHDSQQILIKHGGTYVRVHPCRVLLREAEPLSTSSKNNDSMTPPQQETQALAIDEDSSDDTIGAPNDYVLNKMTPDGHNEDVSTMTNENSGNSQSSQLDEARENAPTLTVKKGMDIEYLNDAGNWIGGKVMNRSGKVTGKYKSNWNVRNFETDEIEDVDFEKVVDWRLKENRSTSIAETCMTYNLSEVFLSEMNSEVENAKQKELDNWIEQKVYEEVCDKGQRFMSARWVVTPKLIEGDWSTKARLVARGYEEDSSQFRTDSPTCMKESLRLILSVSSSNGWSIHSLDIKAAFLQGKQIDRELYLRPPKEAKAPGKLWLLKKAVYGLSDASRVWYLRVTEELTKLGARVSTYDKAVFFWVKDSQLAGVILVHVDDFLWAGSEKFKTLIMDPFKKNFKISTESDDCFKYVGLEIKQSKDGLLVSQKEYVKSLKPVAVQCSSDDRLLDQSEKRLFRGINGQLGWASNMTRPDISFECCQLSTAQSAPRLSDLKRANKVLRELQVNDSFLKFPVMELENSKLIVYSDASYANLNDGASQGGFAIFLADSTGKCSLISWGSRRIRRVARSTLSAETQSAVEALDTAYML